MNSYNNKNIVGKCLKKLNLLKSKSGHTARTDMRDHKWWLFYLPTTAEASCATCELIFLQLTELGSVVMLLACILKVPDLNLDCEFNQPNECYSWFYSVPPGKCQSTTTNYVIILCYPLSQCHTVWGIDSFVT